MTGSDEVPGVLVALDTLELGFAFFGRGWRLQHASPVFLRAVEDPTFAALDEEVRRFVAAVWGLANVRSLGAVVERLDSRAVRLAGGECRLDGTYVGVDLFGEGASVLVGVRVPPEDPFSTERLRARFGLTCRQSRVASLLVEGLRNDEIARRLFISPHTARHHVEQIRLKVGGHTRAAVASRLLQAER
ncbi:MAG TPA: helix-turn-helix transcriptional regulator [Longimicrobium sp.]|nr:helix-turn-helix transcriptional regulator [Longimicrobium sp.]